MKHIAIALLAVTGLSVGVSQVASAADLPVKGPVYKAPVAAPAYSWTGFYIGGNAGYGWGNANDAMTLGGFFAGQGGGDANDFSNNRMLTPLGNNQLNPNGFIGGVQAGYNYQTGQWVFGVEADANYFGLNKSFSTTVLNQDPVSDHETFTFASSFNTNWLVTVRPRIGFASTVSLSTQRAA